MAARDIYRHEDFRQLLAALYAERADRDPELSHRKFAAEAGFTNPGFLNDVIKGRRKLSADATDKMIAGFKLTSGEAEYFRLLVAFGQAKNAADRDSAYQQILFRRSRSQFARVQPALARYYQDYRYPLLRSALEVSDCRGDWEALGRRIHPAIPANVARKMVEELVRWGLALKRPDGRYAVTSKFVEPSPTLREQVRSLNRTWLQHAQEALTALAPEERHISTILLGVSEETHAAITAKIEALRQEIFRMADEEQRPTRTMQLSVAYFPRIRTVEARDEK